MIEVLLGGMLGLMDIIFWALTVELFVIAVIVALTAFYLLRAIWRAEKRRKQAS